MNILILLDIVDDPEEIGEKLFVSAVVETFDVGLDFG